MLLAFIAFLVWSSNVMNLQIESFGYILRTTENVKQITYKVERITESLLLGEGPFWDVETQSLYFVDAFSDAIHKYKPSTNEHTSAFTGGKTTFIFPLEGATNKFVISLGRSIVAVTWDGISDTIGDAVRIAETDTGKELENNNLNDGKVDPTGTLWTGTMAGVYKSLEDFPDTGSLYSLNRNRQLKLHVGGIRISNGFAWSSDLEKLYYIDSLTRSIDQFDLDAKNQVISNRQSVFSLDKHNIEGIPDGQTIDVDGNLWVAICNGSKILNIDPRRPETLLRTIEMPAKQVTSVAFGGKDLDELYVTTGRIGLFGDAPTPPVHGSVYKITGLGVKGYGGIRPKFNGV